MTEQEARDVSDREVLAKHTIAPSNAAGVRREIRLGRGESDGEIVEFDRLPGDLHASLTSPANHARGLIVRAILPDHLPRSYASLTLAMY